MIGVTGHRDLRLEDLPELRRSISRLLQEIRKRWTELQGETSGSVYLLTGMAAGADQLAADCALELGIQVIAVLPMALEQFKEDFPTEDERTRLQSYVDRSSAVETMPDAGSTREAQYEAAGTYISRNSSVLIALWDGIHVNRIGGTSHVVRMKLFGSDANVDGPLPSLEISTPGPVCHILTPRKSSPIQSNFEIRVLRRAEEGDDVQSSSLDKDLSISEAIRRQAEYNADWLRLSPKLGSKAGETAKNFLPTSPASSDEEYLREQFAIADTLASHFQKWSVLFVKVYFVLLLIAGIVLEGGYYVPGFETVDFNPFEIAYLALMLLLGFLYWLSSRKNYHNRYHEYRSLAEALRIQLFWRMGGLQESVADHYLAHQVGDMGWICKALYAVHLPLAPPRTTDFPALREHWVEDQLNFFKKSVKINSRISNRLNYMGGWFLILSFVWVFLRIWSTHITNAIKDKSGFEYFSLETLFVLFAGTSVIAFVFFGYDHFRGFSENAKRQLAMIPLCEMAMRVLSRPISGDAARQVVLQLGREALAENGYWLVMHHQQELDLG